MIRARSSPAAITDDTLRAMSAAAIERGDLFIVLSCAIALGEMCGDTKCDATCPVRQKMRASLAEERDALLGEASPADEFFDAQIRQIANGAVDGCFDFGCGL